MMAIFLEEINLDFLKNLVQHYPLPRIDKAGTGYIGRDGVKVPKTIINRCVIAPLGPITLV